MNKKAVGIIVGIIGIVLILVGVILLGNNNSNNDVSGVKIESSGDLYNVISKIHNDLGEKLPMIDTLELDLADEYSFSRYTGLSNSSDVESAIVAMPMINAQAYEALILKAKAGADIEKMKQEMLDNINMNMWVCVSASKLYITNYKDVIFLVMSQDDEWTNPVFDGFKAYVGENNIGKVLEKNQDFDDVELPPEILSDPAVGDFEVYDGSGEDIENVSGENLTNETISGEETNITENTASILPMEGQIPVVE